MKGKSGVGLDEVQSDWPYYNSMLFLDQADIYRGGTSGASSFINRQQDQEEDDFENDRSDHGDGEEEQGDNNHQETPSFSDHDDAEPGKLKS